MKIGILAVQGAFAEHKSKLEKPGCSVRGTAKKMKTWMETLKDWFCQAVRVRYRENSFGSWKCLSL